MSTQTLEQLHASAKTKAEEMVNLLDKIDGETSPTQDQLKSWNDTRVGLTAEMKALNDQIERMEARDQANAIIRRASQPFGGMVFDGAQSGAAKSLGEQFTDSDAFKTWFKSVAGESGRIPDNKSGNLPTSAPMEVAGGLKTLLIGGTTWAVPADVSGNALVAPEHRGLVDMGTWMRPLRIVDLLGRETTQSEIIYYVRVTGATTAAAPTAEATATGGSSGAKPEGGLTFEVKQAIVRTIPVWVPATRQALADAGQLRGIIDEYLTYEVAREIEDQIITGDNTGENFEGIENLTGKLTQAWSTDRLTTARKARTNLILNGRVMPNGWALHPNDWEGFDLETDNENRYFFGGPQSPGRPTLWGTPVVETEAVTQGSGILADWTRARLADREQTTIRVSDSHSDFFTRNLIAVLAEARAAFYVPRPKAFCKTTLTA